MCHRLVLVAILIAVGGEAFARREKVGPAWVTLTRRPYRHLPLAALGVRIEARVSGRWRSAQLVVESLDGTRRFFGRQRFAANGSGPVAIELGHTEFASGQDVRVGAEVTTFFGRQRRTFGPVITLPRMEVVGAQGGRPALPR
jgi:hypothetical protein